MPSPKHMPLYVDLDGTLLKGDAFLEGALRMIKANPFKLFSFILWILQGRAEAKQKVARAQPLDPRMLSYNADFLAFLKTQKKAGRPLHLATAAPKAYADVVAEDLGLFTDILATDGVANVKGAKKAEVIKAHSEGAAFAYAGDSKADISIWDTADAVITVNADAAISHRYNALGTLETSFPAEKPKAAALRKAMRPHQWAKNLLIFVPLGLSHGYGASDAVFSALLAFAAFSLCASGVYLLNDLLDLEADREHPTKQHRPLAAGTLPIATGIAFAALLPAGALALAAVFLPLKFVAALIGYYTLTNAYSFYLKRKPTADVLTLAVLYTARIVAGGLAIAVPLTSWLLGFSIFLFLSLAYLKRYIELSERDESDGDIPGRGYSAVDTEGLFTFGVGAMYAACVVLAIYIESTIAAAVYKSPELLWSLCLILLFWGNRIWTGARRGKIHDDPIVFAIKDNMSRLTGIFMVTAVLAARYV